jgi:hypothetical protein
MFQNKFKPYITEHIKKFSATYHCSWFKVTNLKIQVSLYLDSLFDLTPISLDVIFDEDFLVVKLVEDFTPLLEEDFLQELWTMM